MVYRKSRQGDMWHCCRNCRFWPERRGAYVERNSKPASGELCELAWLACAVVTAPLWQPSTFGLDDFDYEARPEC